MLDQVDTKTRSHRFETPPNSMSKETWEMQPGGAPDMSALLAQAQQVQQQLMEAQEALANSEVHGQAGGGLVQVTMKGSGEVIGVAIDPKVVDPADVETLQDLVVGAIKDASAQVTMLAQSKLGPLAGGLGGLGLPGA
jgi:nucleoid-associated protein EbfC